MTEDELQAMERLANAATPGPWEYDGYKEIEAFGPDGRVTVLEIPQEWHEGSEYTGAWSTATGSGDDMKFAAAARAAVPALVAEVRRLRAAVREALLEGAGLGEEYTGRVTDQQMWDESDARKALDA